MIYMIEKYGFRYDQAEGLLMKDSSHEYLYDFLNSIQYPENITDHFIPEINKALNGEIVLDAICSGTVCASLDKNIVILEWQTRSSQIPTEDFKQVLSEYLALRW